jgi:hypothetical protein
MSCFCYLNFLLKTFISINHLLDRHFSKHVSYPKSASRYESFGGKQAAGHYSKKTTRLKSSNYSTSTHLSRHYNPVAKSAGHHHYSSYSSTHASTGSFDMQSRSSVSRFPDSHPNKPSSSNYSSNISHNYSSHSFNSFYKNFVNILCSF